MDDIFNGNKKLESVIFDETQFQRNLGGKSGEFYKQYPFFMEINFYKHDKAIVHTSNFHIFMFKL